MTGRDINTQELAILKVEIETLTQLLSVQEQVTIDQSNVLEAKMQELLLTVEKLDTEIIQRKKAETAIIASEEKFRKLFEYMTSGVAIYTAVDEGADFVFDDFNPAAQKIDHLNKAEIIGRRVTECYPGIKEFGLLEVLQRVWKTGKPEYFTGKFYKDSRISGWRDNYVYKLPSGETVAVYDDISERMQLMQKLQAMNDELETRVRQRTADLEKANQALQDMIAGQRRIEGALRDSKERYKKITSSITDYIYSVRLEDGHPVETVHGPGCVAVTGYTAEEFNSKPLLWIAIVPQEDREIIKEQIEDIYARKSAQAIEHRIIRKDGSICWVKNTPVLYFDNQNRLVAYDGVVKDITAIKVYEQKLLAQTEKVDKSRQEAVEALNKLKRVQAANISILANLTRSKQYLEKQSEDLQRALAAKNEFTSTVSHELRTPLAISKEALSLLKREKVGPLSDKQKEIISMADSNIDRLGILINDILDIAKMEDGKMELHKETLEILAVVRENCKGWQMRVNTKNITLDVITPDNPVMLNVDKARFLQILSNLINNAIKFTPESGRINVLVEEVEDVVSFSVADSGPGIAKEDFPKLFQKFQQLNRAYGPGMQGTGLGLSIAKTLVELHGGLIQVESELGRGTTFRFTIPKSG